ncbi:MAG: hypothetical protein HS113_21635 [Verrucomicrobiales bacterium]|nr:hypothetical protein [Verrucomicrobiales bacterium]
MHPLVIILPLLIVLSGVALFFFLPLEPQMRVFLLVSELFAAGVVAVVLAKRFGR